MNKPVYKLLDWIDIKKLNWNGLSRNPNAIDLIKNNLDKVKLLWLLTNPNLINIINLIDTTLLEKCLKRFSNSGSNRLFKNIDVVKMLKNYPDCKAIDWSSLSLNPDTIQFQNYLDDFEIDWNCLSLNICDEAIEILKQNPDKINWRLLSYNSNDKAVELLKQNPDKIVWDNLSHNKNSKAIEILKQKPDKIVWDNLSQNPNIEAIKILKENLKKINWRNLAINSNPEAIKLLKTNKTKLVCDDLAINITDEAIDLLIENIDDLTDIGWNMLVNNSNSKAIQLLKNNLNKIYTIYYRNLSYNKNPDMMELLKENQHLIYWNELSDNPNIFKLDYEQMKKNFELLSKEIIEAACNPERIVRYMKQYNISFENWFN
jgi:hypothetical protein